MAAADEGIIDGAVYLIIFGAVGDILKGILPERTVHGAGFRNHKRFLDDALQGFGRIERLVFPVGKERFDYTDGAEFLGDDSPERQLNRSAG